MIEKLRSFTPAAGASFPFSVEEVDELSDWIPRDRCIAVCGTSFRVHEGIDGTKTANALRLMVATITDGTLTEWVDETPGDN